MHILIIGAAGMVGRKLVSALIAEGRLGGTDITALTLSDIVTPEKPHTAIPVEAIATDLSAPGAAETLIAARPDLIFHLAAIVSGEAEADFDKGYRINLDGTRLLLEAIRLLGLTAKTRFYQASTSELYGLVQEVPQKESTPFYPRSPYAVAKLYAYWITVNYREAYDMYAVNGILFNHESPVRGETFVTRKITRGVAAIATGREQQLFLGNMDARRDWGHAKDYVEAMWRMLQQEKPEDYVIATGETTSVRDFVKMAFQEAGIEIAFQGSGMAEKGLVVECRNPAYTLATGQEVVSIDPRYFRPTEVDMLIGDASKAEKQLGWKPAYTLQALVREMVHHDLALLQ